MAEHLHGLRECANPSTSPLRSPILSNVLPKFEKARNRQEKEQSHPCVEEKPKRSDYSEVAESVAKLGIRRLSDTAYQLSAIERENGKQIEQIQHRRPGRESTPERIRRYEEK